MDVLKNMLWSTQLTIDDPGDGRCALANRFALLLHALLCVLIIFVIEWMSRRSFVEAWGFMTGSPAVFAFNALLVFVSLLFVFPFRHRTVARIIISVVWVALGAVNGIILSQRVTPFSFTDMSMIEDLLMLQDSKYFEFWQEVLVVVLAVLLIIFLIWLCIKGPRYRGNMSRVLNLVLAIVCFALTPVIMKSAIHAGIMAGYFGNLAQGYKEYGFVYSFACSVFDTGITEDSNYSEETIEGICNNVQVSETTLAEDDEPNIIMIQLESFVDPYDLNFLTYSEDPTPNYHKLMAEYGSGAFTVPVVGAGTCNTEFECLSGMGIQFFGIGEYPYKTVLKDTTYESCATALDSIGYTSHVLHNNTATFYGRNDIFARMGFDTFTSKEMMNAVDMNDYGTWLADDILTSETEKTLDSTTGADFIYTITVQSHGSYPTEQVIEDPEVMVYGLEDNESLYWQYQYYINELRKVDDYIGELIDMLEQRDEKTIVMMYGDHLPTLGIEEDQTATGNLFNTSYVTWNNFGLEMEDKDIAAYESFAYLTNVLGIHEGTMFKLHQYAMDNDLEGTEEFTTAWRLLQYDLLYGKHYAYGGKDPDFMKDLEFGVEDVVIDNTDLDAQTGQFYIYGQNFTPWSKVYVNGEKVSTTYVSGDCLRVSVKSLEDAATIQVRQMCSSLTLRVSNEITFHAPSNLEELGVKSDEFDAEQERIAAAEKEALEQAEAAERDAREAAENQQTNAQNTAAPVTN